MKKKGKIIILLMLSINTYSVYAENYIYSIDKKNYKNSLNVVKDNNQENQSPVCGSSNGLSIDIKPSESLCQIGVASQVNTIDFKYNWSCENNDESIDCNATQIINTAKHSSCKDILLEYPHFAGQDGIYQAKVAGVDSSLYCNMTDQGGGWSLIVAQFEGNPVNWNQGVSANYDASANSVGESFAFNSSQIPSHTQMSFSHSNYDNKKITNIFNYQYTTGNIETTLILDIMSGINYQINRSSIYHCASHDPELGCPYIGTIWEDTLTIDRYGLLNAYSYSFGIKNSIPHQRDYAYKGFRVHNVDNGAWLIFVR